MTSSKDTVIEIDWTFVSGKTEKKRWMYFQEGAVITGLDENKLRADGSGRVLARYSQNGDVAASVTRYGKGWVALVGPHPEANDEWCEYCPFLGFFDISVSYTDRMIRLGGKLHEPRWN